MRQDTDQLIVLHLSDVHFGSILANNQFPWVSGWAAHDLILCLGLPLAVADVCALLSVEEEDIHLVVTGDLTSTGSALEFPVAHTFLRSEWHMKHNPPKQIAGMRALPDMLATIPGNHDHWKGGKIPPQQSYAKEIFNSQFEPTPWRRLWTSKSENIMLELYGIDSNSGFQDVGAKRSLMQKGMISSEECDGLEKLVQQTDREFSGSSMRRIRSILCHHSLSYSGGFVHLLELEQDSRRKLLKIAARHKFSTILTGHTHDFYNHPFEERCTESDLAMETLKIWELRSGTTLRGPSTSASGQGFLAHRLRLNDEGAAWDTWRYQWDGTRFVRRTSRPTLSIRCN